MFKKVDFNFIRGYDEKMKKGWEDWEFFIRLLIGGGYVYVLNEPLYNYRKRKKSTTKTANNNRYELFEYIFLKHKELYIKEFERTLKFLLSLSEKNEKNEIKRINSWEYKIGYYVLKPLRFIKSIFRKNGK
jgi:hypothetical protein